MNAKRKGKKSAEQLKPPTTTRAMEKEIVRDALSLTGSVVNKGRKKGTGLQVSKAGK